MGPNSTLIYPPERKALSVTEFCLTYSLSRSKAFGLLAEGKLARYKVGRKTLIRIEDAEAWFRTLEPRVGR